MNKPGPLQPPGSHALHVAYADNFNDACLQHAFDHILSQPEKEKNLRYKHYSSRKLHLIARLMARSVLSHLAPHVPPADWAFQPNPHGKPEIKLPHSLAGNLHFNLSHTSGIVVLAVSNQGPVGVDVESIYRPMDHLQLAARYFAPAECQALNQSPTPDRPALFYRFWTLKEAYVKALGTGLAHPLDTFWFNPLNLSEPHPTLVTSANLTNTAAQPDPTQHWNAQVLSIGPDNQWVISIVNAASGPPQPTQTLWPLHEFQYNPA